MVYLETLDNGEKYSNIWVRILLLCLKDTEENAGFLRFNSSIPYDDKLLSKVLRKDIDTIRSAMAIFKRLGMIEILDDGTLYVEEVQHMIGSEASSAERVRKHRERRKALQCNGGNALQTLHVTNDPVTMSHNISRSREEVEEEVEEEKKQNVTLWKTEETLCKEAWKTFEKIHGTFIPNQTKEADAINKLVHMASQSGDTKVVLTCMMKKLVELKENDTSKNGFWRTQPYLPSTLVSQWSRVWEEAKIEAHDEMDAEALFE
jgi:predicted phage replisome organizer